MARPTAVPARPGPQRRSGLMVGRTRPPATCWSTTPCERPGEIFSRFDRTRSFEPSPTSPEMTATGAPAPVGPVTGSRVGHCPAALPDTPPLVSPWPHRRPIEAIEHAAIGLGIGAINLGGPRAAERALYLSMGYHGRHEGGLLTKPLPQVASGRNPQGWCRDLEALRERRSQRLAATSDSHEQPRPTPETGWRSAHALRLDPSRRWPR